MRFAMLGAVLLLAGVALAPRSARACSCVEPADRLLLPSPAEIPRNTGGLPLWTRLEKLGTTLQLPPRAWVKLERIGHKRPLPFDLVLPRARFAQPAVEDGSHGLVLIKPRARLAPGARYRLTFQIPASDRRHRPAQVVEFVVSREALAAGPASLSLGPPEQGDLRVAGGSACSEQIVAAQQPIELVLPEAARRWRDVLLYRVKIDDKLTWRPTQSLCTDLALGESWRGPGRELLFVACEATGQAPLAPGVHTVEMSAWLPGTDLTFSATARTTLACR